MANSKLNLRGKKFNNLTGVKFSHIEAKYGSNRTMWEFKCDCGNSHINIASEVKRGKIKSCGCLNIKGKNNGNWKGYEDIGASMFNYYKMNAKKRGINFNITIENLWDIYIKQNKKCPYTSIKLNLKNKKTSRLSINASLDRIDSLKGYELDNLQWVYKPINNLKNNMTHTEFLNMCLLISENSKL